VFRTFYMCAAGLRFHKLSVSLFRSSFKFFSALEKK
jgi:hypothetical protein